MSFITFISFFAIINNFVLSFYFLSKPSILLNRLISAILLVIDTYIAFYLAIYTKEYGILEYILPLNFIVTLGAFPLLSIILENLTHKSKVVYTKKKGSCISSHYYPQLLYLFGSFFNQKNIDIIFFIRLLRVNTPFI